MLLKIDGSAKNIILLTTNPLMDDALWTTYFNYIIL